jgi:hypothetical protein
MNAAVFAAMGLAGSAQAAETDAERPMTQQEIEAWLDAHATPGTADVTTVDEPPEAPPLPPRHRGVVLEGSVGALGHLGPLRQVSPTGPYFQLLIGYEPFVWLMVFGEGDLSFSSTSNAHPPPEPRAYALYGFGAGARATFRPTDRLGIYGQGSIGAAQVSEDVLATYGFRDADELNPFFGARLGLEWYQVNPHYALAVHGGIRSYPDGFARERSTATPVALIGGASLRYAF